MKKIIIDISDYKDLENLEKAYFEITSYETIINHLMTSNRDDTSFIKSNLFNAYMQEFQVALMIYEREKKLFTEFMNQIIVNNNYTDDLDNSSWQILDFNLKQAVLTIPEV